MAIEFHYKIVAFIDILGFSRMVREDAESMTLKHLDSIIKTIGVLEKPCRPSLTAIQIFSDSIILTAPLSTEGVKEIAEAILSLQAKFLENSILLRGGLAFGRHYQDQRVLFSEALINAYIVEKTLSRFPRVLIEHNLWDWFINHDQVEAEIKKYVEKLTIIDSDGYRFLNYIDHNKLEEQRALILTSIENAPKDSPSVLDKYQWLVRYFNFIALNAERKDLQIEKLQTGFSLGLQDG